MSDPQARQDAALAAVDRLIEIARAARGRRRSGGMWSVVDGTAFRGTIGDAHGDVITFEVPTSTHAAHIVANDPETTLAQLEGRRRILERHAPEYCAAGQHWVCSCHDGHLEWPDDDWLDAAAGLPLEDTNA